MEISIYITVFKVLIYRFVVRKVSFTSHLLRGMVKIHGEIVAKDAKGSSLFLRYNCTKFGCLKTMGTSSLNIFQIRILQNSTWLKIAVFSAPIFGQGGHTSGNHNFRELIRPYYT